MKYLESFLKSEVPGGILLIISAVTAMLLANLDFTREFYYSFLQIPISLRIGSLEINKNILLWINDALMTLFFLLVSLEVKKEVVEGSMASYQQAIFPVIAAFGGMLVPATIYMLFNFLDPIARNGWAIPIATDIAFALGVLELLGKRVSMSLKIFLMALSIIDDLGAIAIIALFYTKTLSIFPLGVVGIAITVLTFLNIWNIRYLSIYMLVGVTLWIAVLQSGIHATLAGVIVGFFVPLKGPVETSPSKKLEHVLYPWVVFLILPLFAFANAGISLQNVTSYELTSSLPIGIITGLFIGKPTGITLFCWLAMKFKLATLPKGTTWRQIMAVGVLCGIGFTMSIFISTLAFGTIAPEFVILAKLAILTGSLLAAVVGFSIFKTKLLSPSH